MCEKCQDKGYIVIDDDIVYCVCSKGKKMKEIEEKRNQKGYNDNY